MEKNQQGFNTSEVLLIFVLICIISFTGWYVWNTNSRAKRSLDTAAYPSVKQSTEVPPADIVSPEYFKPFEKKNGVPSGAYDKTDNENVSIAWQDGRVVDGNFNCILYRSDDKLILATFYITSGQTGKVDQETKYINSSLSRPEVDNLVSKYCER